MGREPKESGNNVTELDTRITDFRDIVTEVEVDESMGRINTKKRHHRPRLQCKRGRNATRKRWRCRPTKEEQANKGDGVTFIEGRPISEFGRWVSETITDPAPVMMSADVEVRSITQDVRIRTLSPKTPPKITITVTVTWGVCGIGVGLMGKTIIGTYRGCEDRSHGGSWEKAYTPTWVGVMGSAHPQRKAISRVLPEPE